MHFPVLSSGNTLWKIQLLPELNSTSSEAQASSALFTSQHCQNFLPHLVSWANSFLMKRTGEIPGSILSLLQLLISVEATSAYIWRLHLILRALTSQMLDTHHSGGVWQHRPTKGRAASQMWGNYMILMKFEGKKIISSSQAFHPVEFQWPKRKIVSSQRKKQAEKERATSQCPSSNAESFHTTTKIKTRHSQTLPPVGSNLLTNTCSRVKEDKTPPPILKS